MKKDLFIFKKDIKPEVVKSSLVQRIDELISLGGEDFKVEIKPHSERSLNALGAYWMLIGAVVKWDKENGFSGDVWSEWFKRDVGLIEKIDMLPMWMKKPRDKNGNILLGDERYIEKTRSLANFGDITKNEMSNLIETVLNFGAVNAVPNCFISSPLDELLSFSRGGKDE